VKLTVEDSRVVEGLKLVEKLGMKIVICGSCLDYFGLRDQVAVGDVGGMDDIVELFRTASNVIRV
jgi:sulfur relay (sulfurtransferase) complex TusBCD TusD component (DsrE family)